MDEKEKCTQEEYGLMTAKICSLQADRQNLVDKKINFYRRILKEAEQKLEALDKEIESLKERQNRMDPVSYNPYAIVRLNSIVRFMNLKRKSVETFIIVQGGNSQLPYKSISIDTPIAKAILGKKIGDIVEIRVPAGVQNIQILDIINP